MMRCIGIDIGYGFCKTYTDIGTKSFPSCVSAIVPKATFSEVKPVLVNGQQFLVGKDAEQEGIGTIKTTTSDYIMSDAWIALLGHALNVNNIIPALPAVMVTGTPPGAYTREYANRIIEKIKESTVFIPFDNKEYIFANYTIKVIPQGGGIFFSYISDHEEDTFKTIAIIDIGHRTIDFSLFSRRKYIEGATESINAGIVILLDKIRKGFYRKYQQDLGYAGAIELLNTGKITILGEDYTVEDLYDIASAYYRQIESFINDFFERATIPIDIGVVGGGGVLTLKGKIKLKRKLTITDNPVFANAIGYWKYGGNTWR